ncbi:MAG TPA: GNAT family N-acetyltransferase [Gemmatimonadaceae bacterium]
MANLMKNVTLADGIVIRELATHEDRARAVRLQEVTWGAGFTERVPAAMLLVGEKLGGVSAGAFTPDGTLVGFVFGLTGLKDGRLVHWSDMLAVTPKVQGRGIGRALKYYQRDRCRAIGVETMYWTFDPFVARNAQLNLCRLGARVVEFVPDMYGADTNSPEHGSLGTDRLVAAWPVSAEAVPLPSGGEALRGAPVVAGRRGDALAPGATLPDATAVTVRVPADYHALLANDLELAREWRMSARRAFLHYLSRGYQVSAFSAAGGDAAYLLTR